MKRKKVCVLHAQVPFVRGGAENMVESLVRELRLRGYDAELVSMPFKWYPADALFDAMLAWRLADLTEVNGEPIDLVVACKFPTYCVEHPNKALWLMHQFRGAYDLYGHPEHGLVRHPDGERIRDRVKAADDRTLAEAHPRYAISRNVSDRLKRFNGLDAAPLYHPPKLVGRYRTDGYDGTVLSVGRLDAIKRVGLLLEALALVPGAKAGVAGDGPYRADLERQAERLGLADRVAFLGAVSDERLLDLYANAGAVYFAPVDEDYGYVTLEAFLSGKPVLTCFDAGAVLEFAVDGRNAVVTDPDAAALASGLSRLASDAALCRRLGGEGREAVQGIGWDAAVDALTVSLR